MFAKSYLTALKRLLDYLTQPPAYAQTAEQRQKVRILSSLSFALIIVIGIVAPLWIVTSPDFEVAPLISLSLIILFCIAYGISRTRFYIIGAVILVVTIPVLVLSVILSAPGLLTERMLALQFLVVSGILSRSFFQPRVTALVVGISLLIMGSFFFIPAVPFPFAFAYLVFFLVILSLDVINTVLAANYKKRLQDSEERYRSVVTALTEGIVVQMRDGTIQASNIAAQHILGLSEAQMMGRDSIDPRWEAIHEDGSPFPGESHPAMITLRTGQPLSNIIMGIHKPDGERRWISINSQPLIHLGETLAYAVVTSFMDITTRKQQEELLREAEHRYHALFEQSHDAVFILDLAGRHIEANHRAAEMLGFTITEIQQLTYNDLSAEMDESHNILERLLAGEQIPGYERTFRKKDGSVLVVEINVELVRNYEGVGVHIQSVVRDISERKKAEEVLRDNEARYRNMFEHNAAIKLLIDSDSGAIVDANTAAVDFYGYSLDQLKAMHIQDINTLTDAEITSEMALAASEQRKVFNFRHRLASGEIRYVEVFSGPVIIDGKKLLYSIIQDVTARTQAEVFQHAFLEDMQALQKLHLELNEIDNLEHLYQKMIQLSQQRLGIDRVGLFILDHTTNQLRGTYGVAPDGLIRDEHYFQEPITSDHWTLKVLDSYDHVLFWEEALIYDNGIAVGSGWKAASALWSGRQAIGYLVTDNFVTHKPARPYEAELISILGTTFGHLIERKLVEEILRTNEARQRVLLNAIPDLVFRIHRDGTFLDYHATNPAHLAMLPDQFMGRKIEDVLPPEIAKRHMHLIERALQTHEEQMHEYVLPVRGQLIDYEARILVSGQDEVLTLVRNISERKQAQQREFELVLERERVRLLRQFIEKASHEFRTPLSIINTSAFLMARLEGPEQRQLKAAGIEQQVKRTTKLVDMLLKMAQLESGGVITRSSVDMALVFETTCKDMVTRYGDRPILRREIWPPVPPVIGNADYLTEALDQILDNAYRFTPADGSITVSMRVEDGHVWLTICDTGSGISEANRPHIFEIFWRQDEAHTTPGFGLGLPIAQKIVEMHSGRIEVESEIGVGTTVSLVLPLLTSSL